MNDDKLKTLNDLLLFIKDMEEPPYGLSDYKEKFVILTGFSPKKGIDFSGIHDERASGNVLISELKREAGVRIYLSCFVARYVFCYILDKIVSYKNLYISDVGSENVSFSELVERSGLTFFSDFTLERQNSIKKDIVHASSKEFLGFNLNFEKLYSLIFEEMFPKESSERLFGKSSFGIGNNYEYGIDEEPSVDRNASEPDSDNTPAILKAEYLKGLILGKYDMSREMFLLFMAGIRTKIKDFVLLEDDPSGVYNRHIFPDLELVDEMLEQLSYPDLGDLVADRSSQDGKIRLHFERIFYALFSAQNDVELASGALSVFLSEVESKGFEYLLPFELTRLNNRKSEGGTN